jgi:site-specific recombinase XerD
MIIIEDEIRQASANIANRTGIASFVIEKVEKKLLSAFENKRHYSLTHDEVKTIGDSLTIGSRHSYQTWLHCDCLNRFIYELKKNKIIDGPYFNIPQQIRRHLIVHLEKEMEKNVVYVHAIQRELMALSLQENTDLKDEEEDCICSFIASSAIFAKILFDGFEKGILSLKWQDILLDPAFIEIPLCVSNDGAEETTFYRYFLPSPSSIYLLRCILFYKRNKRKLGIRKYGVFNSLVFPSINCRTDNLNLIFKKWTMKKLMSAGFDTKGLSITEFRDAAVMTSVIDALDFSGNANQYPPFIMSIHSRVVESDSFDRKFVPFIKTDSADIRDMAVKKEKGVKDFDAGKPELKALLGKIVEIIKSLKGCYNLRTRKNAARKIELLISSITDGDLDRGDTENLRVYGRWIINLLYPTKTQPPKLKRKSIELYASDVRSFLSNLDAPISTLDKDNLIRVLKQAMDMFKSSCIRKALRSFMNYMIAECGDSFPSLNWNVKELRKEDIHTRKPLIHFDQVSDVIKKCEGFFCTYPKKYKDDKKRQAKLDSAIYKARIIWHAIHLGFYAGVRVSEFANLKISNIIHDEGLVLCVRASKTESSERNIPIHLLAPEYYLKELSDYLKEKRSENIGSGLLFPQYNGKRWDTSHLASEVGRLFESIGIKNMRFHYLRHAFANWFLMRWFVAFHADYVPTDLPFMENELFRDPYITKLKRLILGMNNKTGQDTFTYALAVLARLIGHGGPLVTMKNYIHCGDWLFYLLSKGSETMEVQITSRQAQELLQLSYPSLPSEFKGRGKKTFTLGEILYYQGLISP